MSDFSWKNRFGSTGSKQTLKGLFIFTPEGVSIIFKDQRSFRLWGRFER